MDRENFLHQAHHFKLGSLITEKPHPKTIGLSQWVKEDLGRSLKVLKEVDLEALSKVEDHWDKLDALRRDVEETLNHGGRVFLCGCGATGRLSLSLERFWRRLHSGSPQRDSVVGFMAGGDLALVTSIENFEDYPEFGAAQLRDLGFSSNDMLISSTEGGETPYVIGATQESASLGAKTWFLYCNPDDLLMEVERSRGVLEDDRVRKLCSFVGPMVISGSTRLQATTLQMLLVGLALLGPKAKQAWESLVRRFESLEVERLIPFIEHESEVYERGEYVSYETDDYGITLLTDTTERSPTFSLLPFENYNFKGDSLTPSLCYLTLLGAPTPQEAWERILERKPRPILGGLAQAIETQSRGRIRPEFMGEERLWGYDFSNHGLLKRQKITSRLHLIKILREQEGAHFSFEGREELFPIGGFIGPHSELLEHLLLKLLMNMYSNAVMGRMGRFESNIMTWVRPNNFKLIDRSIRYVRDLLEQQGRGVPEYDEVAKVLLGEIDQLQEGESIVMKTLSKLESSKT